MAIEMVTCKQCGHSWKPRTDAPIKCPNSKCQSQDWDTRPINIEPTPEPTPEEKEAEEIFSEDNHTYNQEIKESIDDKEFKIL